MRFSYESRIKDHFPNGFLVALVGLTCSGKGTTSQLLNKKVGARIFISSMLVYLYLDLFKDGTRERPKISAGFTTIREFFGGWHGWMIWSSFPKMLRARERYLVYDGVRRTKVVPAVARVARLLRRKLVFVIIEASDEECFRRYRNRKRPGEGAQTLEEFLEERRNDPNEMDADLRARIEARYRYVVLRNDSQDLAVLEADLDRVIAAIRAS